MDATEKWNQQPLVQEEEEVDLQALLHLKSKKVLYPNEFISWTLCDKRGALHR